MQMKTKVFSVGLILIIMCVTLLGLTPTTALAEENLEVTNNALLAISGNMAEPYALFVDIVLGINGSNGEVWSIAQTRVAIFATTIQVVLELYSSETYQEDYHNMTLEKRVSVYNLKQGQTLKAVMPTNGVEKYWKGRVYYKIDSADWKFGVTPTTLYDANGIIVL